MQTTISGDELILSWDKEEAYSLSITLEWFDLLMHVKLEKEVLFKSDSFKILIHVNNTTHYFGYGRSTVGAGRLGEVPKLELGDYYLTFEFKNNAFVFKNNILEGKSPSIDDNNIFTVINIPSSFCFDEQEEDLE
jgi:hypothetical protein